MIAISNNRETVNEYAVAQGQWKENRQYNYTELRAQLTHLIKSTVASVSVQTIFGLLVLSFEVC